MPKGELNLFLEMFCEDARQIVLSETNRYADQTGDFLTRRWPNWTDLNDGDLLKYEG
jgi:hypothetical protein